jgi:hypothetical protein
MDGGRAAARGFLYQYLRTAEAALIALTTDARVHACRMEGDPYPTELGSADIVDFDLTDRNGMVLRSVQVKSGEPGAQLSAGDVFTILARLVARVDAEGYALLTNVSISAGAAEVARLLALHQSHAERLAALRPLLRGAAGRHLAGLTDEQIRRLGRCEISVDRRSRTELRDALLHAVLAARRDDGRGIGVRSSGLLLAYLHWEIHRRAASPEDAVWAMSDIREVLHLDDRALVGALGERDWGGVLGLLPPVPDVRRTEFMEAIAGALNPFRPIGRTVGRCALTGLSGIGKSSLAAGYVAEYLDAYDMVFWFDASNPPYTLIQGFRTAAGKLGVDPDVSAERLRTAVHERLSRLVGRWLIVFDDAPAVAIPSWVPRIGDGDVLITSIDSTCRFGTTRHISVGGMSPAEAASLLAARLELSTEQARVGAGLIRRLAAALDYWPLALELAAGYLRSCGYTITDIPHYLEKLKLRSLDDWSSIPEGYPATLIAAIDLAAGRLAAPGTDPALLNLAASMVMEAAYLSARQIPVHLLISASQTGLDTLPADRGPIIFEDPRIHEAVRSLRRVSFARLDQPLPRRETDMATAEHTISMNSVLQEVMRARAEKRSGFQTWKTNLERLALHLDHWLSSAIHNGESDKAHLLVPHADTLVHHLRRLGLTSGRVPLLIGNLAGVYTATNDLDTAIGLFNTELQLLLNAERPDEFLVHQARLHLAQALTTSEQIDAARAAESIENLEHIAMYSQRLAAEADTHEAASHFCSHSLDILDKIIGAGHAPQNSRPLAEVFADVLRRVPATWDIQVREAASQANAFLSAGRPEEAERVCRPHVMPLRYGSNLQLELQRLLIEALTFQGRWSEARTEIATFAARLGREPLYQHTTEDALHNIGLPLAMVVLLGGGQEPTDLFTYLMSRPCFLSVRRAPQPSYEARFCVLNLVLAVVQNSRPGISKYMHEARHAKANDASLANNPAWLLLTEKAISLADEE